MGENDGIAIVREILDLCLEQGEVVELGGSHTEKIRPAFETALLGQ